MLICKSVLRNVLLLLLLLLQSSLSSLLVLVLVLVLVAAAAAAAAAASAFVDDDNDDDDDDDDDDRLPTLPIVRLLRVVWVVLLAAWVSSSLPVPTSNDTDEVSTTRRFRFDFLVA